MTQDTENHLHKGFNLSRFWNSIIYKVTEKCKAIKILLLIMIYEIKQEDF